MPPSRVSRRHAALIFAVPVAWAVLLVFHPVGDGDLYPVVGDELAAWQAVHVGTLLFIPAFAFAVSVLLRGIDGTLALVSRVCLVVFAVVYGAWEAMMGIGTGALASEINALPAAERAAGSDLLQSYAEGPWLGDPGVFATTGSLALIVALLTAGLALVRETGASRAVPVLLTLAALPIAWHVPPFGQAGLALFVGGAWLARRGHAPAVTPAAPHAGAAA
jgi:hypothetical protein